MPFYARVKAAAKDGRFIVAFESLSPEQALTTYLADHGLTNITIKQSIPPPGVTGTPTLLVTDASGRVVKSWAGRLSSKQERDLLGLVHP